jgi:hypothetical protein
VTCELVCRVARTMFERQAAGYDAEPAMTELAWLDDDIREFWLAEASAVLDEIDDARAA